MHLLVWLKNIKTILYKLIRADIPWENPDCAFLVNKIQPSDKRLLQQNDVPTTFEKVQDRNILKLFYPSTSFALNLRAYIETVLPVLKSCMDVQLTDGRSMILRYVTSCVSKWQDAYTNEALYSSHILPFQAAHRHVSQLQTCEPEMWLYLSSIKMSWSQSR